MDDHSSDHKEHSEVHLPDPSIWPLVIGFASLLAGLALVFWVRDRGTNPFAGPALGVAVFFVLLSAFGWAYEDGRMKRKAEAHARSLERDARFTQVVTFAIAEGHIDEARSSGVLHAVEARDSTFRDLAGFQDLRIIVSPATAGPSQVLVETTWSNREGLATYEETRQTLLDLVTAHPDEVVPGSVQVFDMQVIRDTKDVAVRFGLGATATVLGSLVIGGFMVGAGLNLFSQNNPASTSGPAGGATAAPANPAALTVVATDDKFDKSTLTAPANTKITVTLQNNGAAKHNIAFLDKKDGNPLSADSGSPDTAVNGGASGTITFTTPGPGTYYFECEFHPTQMFGTFTVTAAAPGGAGAAPGGGAAAGTLEVSLTDDKIDKSTLTAQAGKPVTVKVTNNGQSKHNLDFLTAKGGTSLAPGAGNDSTFLNAGDSETLTFTVDKPGTYYYQCDLHPDQMFGTFTVT